MAAGLLVGLVAKELMKTSGPDAIVYAGIGALLSDFDSSKSTISSLFPFVGALIDSLTKHRGIIHWGTPILLFSIYLIQGHKYLLFLCIGAASHLLIDLVTTALNIRCGSMGESIIYKLIWASNLLILSNILFPGWYENIGK